MMRQAEFAFGAVMVIGVVAYKSVKLGVTTMMTRVKAKVSK